MGVIKNLLDKNSNWREKVTRDNPDFFTSKAKTHAPGIFWIGCSDSRVPIETIVETEPGEIFVHRNVANLVHYADINLLTTLDFAVSTLKVKDIVVCGHYGCNGVASALGKKDLGLVDHWLRVIKDTCSDFENDLSALDTFEEKHDKLVELNVMRQVKHVCYTPFVQKKWSEGQPLSVHGLVYDLRTGQLKGLKCTISSTEEVDKSYQIHFDK